MKEYKRHNHFISAMKKFSLRETQPTAHQLQLKAQRELISSSQITLKINHKLLKCNHYIDLLK